MRASGEAAYQLRALWKTTDLEEREVTQKMNKRQAKKKRKKQEVQRLFGNINISYKDMVIRAAEAMRHTLEEAQRIMKYTIERIQTMSDEEFVDMCLKLDTEQVKLALLIRSKRRKDK